MCLFTKHATDQAAASRLDSQYCSVEDVQLSSPRHAATRDQEHKEMLRLVLPTRSPLNTTPHRTARRKVQTNDKRRVVSRQNNGFDFQTGQTIWAALDVGLKERERLQLVQAASACLMLSQLACNVRQSQDPIFG